MNTVTYSTENTPCTLEFANRISELTGLRLNCNYADADTDTSDWDEEDLPLADELADSYEIFGLNIIKGEEYLGLPELTITKTGKFTLCFDACALEQLKDGSFTWNDCYDTIPEGFDINNENHIKQFTTENINKWYKEYFE